MLARSRLTTGRQHMGTGSASLFLSRLLDSPSLLPRAELSLRALLCFAEEARIQGLKRGHYVLAGVDSKVKYRYTWRCSYGWRSGETSSLRRVGTQLFFSGRTLLNCISCTGGTFGIEKGGACPQGRK